MLEKALPILGRILKWALPIALGYGGGLLFRGGKGENSAQMQGALPLSANLTGLLRSELSQRTTMQNNLNSFMRDVSKLLKDTTPSPKELTLMLDFVGKLVQPMYAIMAMQAQRGPLSDMLKLAQTQRYLTQAAKDRMFLMPGLTGGDDIPDENLSLANQLFSGESALPEWYLGGK
jgi:hypothetical protein